MGSAYEFDMWVKKSGAAVNRGTANVRQDNQFQELTTEDEEEDDEEDEDDRKDWKNNNKNNKRRARPEFSNISTLTRSWLRTHPTHTQPPHL